jgi:hypothetical protein
MKIFEVFDVSSKSEPYSYYYVKWPSKSADLDEN